jgi:PAS domain S-box-containing protein
VDGILLLLDQPENRRLLAEFLGQRYQVLPDASDGALEGPFDLCVVDGLALDRLGSRLQARKEGEQPVFLPVLFITNRPDIGMATRCLWQSVDELIFVPIEKLELQARVENLLRARRMALELKRRDEEALREEHELNRTILATVQEGIILLDRDLRMLWWNPFMEDMTGLSAREIAGKDPFETFPFLTEAGVLPLLKRALTGERVVSPDVFFFIPSSGKSGWSTARCTPMRNAEGAIAHIVVAVGDITERKQAEMELAASRERLSVLSRRLISIQETERRNLARELHDEIGQVFSAVSFKLKILQSKLETEAAPQLDDSIAIVDLAVQQVRDMSLDLRPSILDDFGLVSALRWYGERFAERTGVGVQVRLGSELPDLPYPVKNTCYRVAQEALTNVGRHARARQSWIELGREADEVALTIRDDGAGFNLAAAQGRAAQGKSLGLVNMQERAELLGGRFEIESSPGQGTTVRVRLPLETEPEAEEEVS